jgi:hypothetical protein
VLKKVRTGLLLNGGVQACDGTRAVHDTLPLTIIRIGVCLVAYDGKEDSWGQTLYRRDLRLRGGGDPLDEILELLDRRAERGGQNQPSKRDTLSDMAQRGILAYAERGILTRNATAPWRLGHGNPAPHELITGSGLAGGVLMFSSTRIIRELVEGHKKFVFVNSEPSARWLVTIGNALFPLEYAVVDTLEDQVARAVAGGSYRMDPKGIDTRWDGKALSTQQWIERFRDTVAPQIVRGVFRASRWSPAQIFYAHRDHFHEAAHIVIADSVMQEHRGFPLLIDLANSVCTGVFGGDSLSGPVATAYSLAGAPWQFQSERMSRQ